MNALIVPLAATAGPALLLLAVGLALRPAKPAPTPVPRPAVRCVCCPRHRSGVRATRMVRRLESEWARRPRPTGWQSPAWTVQPRDGVTA